MRVNFALTTPASNAINIYISDKKNFCVQDVIYGFIRNVQILQIMTIKNKEFQNEVNEAWYCRNCKADMLPFFNRTNNQFLNFLNINIYVSNHQVDENRFTNPVNSFPCSVCYKKNKKTNSLKCNTCKSLIHKKCTKLKTNDILYIKTSKKKT